MRGPPAVPPTREPPPASWHLLNDLAFAYLLLTARPADRLQPPSWRHGCCIVDGYRARRSETVGDCIMSLCLCLLT